MTPRRHQRRPPGSPLSGWAGTGPRHAGGPVPRGIAAAAYATAFWWLTLWLLLADRISWRRRLPPARAVGVFHGGLVWQERGLSFAAAFRKLRRAS